MPKKGFIDHSVVSSIGAPKSMFNYFNGHLELRVIDGF